VRIGHVVESEGRTIRGQERSHVNVEPEQVANRVGVFRTVQPAERGPTRVAGPRAIQFAFEPRD
jgi:hypothetical protein